MRTRLNLAYEEWLAKSQESKESSEKSASACRDILLEAYKEGLKKIQNNYSKCFELLTFCQNINNTLPQKHQLSMIDASKLLMPESMAMLQANYDAVSELDIEKIKGIRRKSVEGLLSLAIELSHHSYLDAAFVLAGAHNAYFNQVKPNHFDVAKGLNLLGSIELRRGQPQRALKHHQQAYDIYQRIGPETRGMMDTLNNLGTVHRKMGVYTESQAILEQGIRLADKKKAIKQQTRLLMNMGRCLEGQLRVEKALGFYEEALQHMRKVVKPSLELVRALNTIGSAYASIQRQKEALALCEEALGITTSINANGTDAAAAWTLKGKLCEQQQLWQEALKCYKYANGINAKSVSGIGSAENFSALARVFFELHKTKSDEGYLTLAIHHQEKALDAIISALKEHSFKTHVYQHKLASYLMQDGKFEQAHTLLHALYKHDCEILKDLTFDFSSYDFFDCIFYTRVLNDLAIVEAKLGKEAQSIQRYMDAANNMKAKERYLLALLLGQEGRNLALKYQKVQMSDELLKLIADIHQAMGHNYQASALDATIPRRALSPQHQSLETLHVEFVNILLDYHRHFASDEQRLLPEDENNTGSLFVSLLSLLDQTMYCWVTSIRTVDRTKNYYFHAHDSRLALQNEGVRRNFWWGILQGYKKLQWPDMIAELKQRGLIQKPTRYFIWTAKAAQALQPPGLTNLPTWMQYLSPIPGTQIGFIPKKPPPMYYVLHLLVSCGVCRWEHQEIYVDRRAQDFAKILSIKDLRKHCTPDEIKLMPKLITSLKQILNMRGAQCSTLTAQSAKILAFTLRDGLVKNQYMRERQGQYIWLKDIAAEKEPFAGLKNTPYAPWMSELKTMKVVKNQPILDQDMSIIMQVHQMQGKRVLELLVAAYPRFCHWNQVQIISDQLTLNDLIQAESTNPYPVRFPLNADVTRATLAIIYEQIKPLLSLDPGLGINAQHQAFSAFERTQTYPYHRTTQPLDGQAWGHKIVALANANKHIKLTNQSKLEAIEEQVRGSFQKRPTKIYVELPSLQLHSWSFTPYIGRERSASLFGALCYQKVIDHHKVYNPGKVHPIIEQVLKGYLQQGKLGLVAPSQVLMQFLSSLDSAFSTQELRDVADLIIDKALQASGLRKDSSYHIALIDLLSQVFSDTQAWLNACFRPEGGALNTLFLRASAHDPLERPLQVSVEATLGSNIEKQLESLRQGFTWLQNQSFDRYDTQERCRYRITQWLIRSRAVFEQSLNQFASFCIYWPNLARQKDIPQGKEGLFWSANEAEFIHKLKKTELLDSGKINLKEHFPVVYQALENMQPHKLNRLYTWMGTLIALTNDIKHKTRLMLVSMNPPTIMLKHNPAFELLPLVEVIISELELFSKLCIDQCKNIAGLFKLARQGGDLSKHQGPYDLVDRMGNTILHWIGKRNDQSQLTYVKDVLSPEQFRALSNKMNHAGEVADVSFGLMTGADSVEPDEEVLLEDQKNLPGACLGGGSKE